MAMQGTKLPKDEKLEAKKDDDSTRFIKSLQELKDLCSQIHYAADYCEISYRNAENREKKAVMENTKEYICRAAVTVVDHLGSVSAQLDCRVSENNLVSETDFRITGLNQRLVGLQKYGHGLSFARLMCWHTNFAGYHARYLFPRPSGSPKEKPKEAGSEWNNKVGGESNNKREFVTEEEMPLFLYTYNHRPSQSKDSITSTTNPTSLSVLPVRDPLSALPKARNPSFDFEATRKIKRNMLTRRLIQSSIIQKSKVVI